MNEILYQYYLLFALDLALYNSLQIIHVQYCITCYICIHDECEDNKSILKQSMCRAPSLVGYIVLCWRQALHNALFQLASCRSGC